MLNSLSGDFIAASLKCLRREGVFVEIGKLGIWSADQMAAARPDVRYSAFDLGEEEAREPGMMGKLLNDVLRRMERGELTPLPPRVFPLTAARQAFRLVAQAKHRGKVVLTLDEKPIKLSLRPYGWYLITGGLGALGLKTADWLIEQGARHVALLGRTASHSEAQMEALARLREKAELKFLQADAADRTALAEALKQIPGPLCGVVHAAGVLDDGALVQLDQSRLAKVLAPKVNGAWNLHELTRNQPLDFFVCFSSAAALLGSPGQANYAAANAYLDSLAHHRRALGLPALSVNWGPWAEGGMAARLSDRERLRLTKMGLQWIDADTGFRLLGQLMADEAVQTAVLPIDWARYLSSSSSAAVPFYHEVQICQPLQPQSPAAPILNELQTAQPTERKLLIVNYLRSEIAAVLGFDPKAISPRGRLFDLGMDSLTAVDLQNRIKRGLAIDLPTTLAFDYPTPSALSDYLLDRLGLAATTAPQPDEADAALATQIEQYTDDEVETLLREKYHDVLRG